MSKNLVCLVLVVLSVMCAGCSIGDVTAEQMDEAADGLTVPEIVEWQAKRRASGPVCSMSWIKGQLDFSTRLQNLHVCSPEAEDAEDHGGMLLDHIQTCTGICVDGFVEGSEGREACKSQCLGDMTEADMVALAMMVK